MCTCMRASVHVCVSVCVCVCVCASVDDKPPCSRPEVDVCNPRRSWNCRWFQTRVVPRVLKRRRNRSWLQPEKKKTAPSSRTSMSSHHPTTLSQLTLCCVCVCSHHVMDYLQDLEALVSNQRWACMDQKDRIVLLARRIQYEAIISGETATDSKPNPKPNPSPNPKPKPNPKPNLNPNPNPKSRPQPLTFNTNTR